MQDDPAPSEILAAVAAFLREQVVPATTGMTAFQARVAANAVDLVVRQLSWSPVTEGAELQRLRTLFGQDGTLLELNAALADGIAAGAIDFAAPDVAQHLRATTLDKLAVDQPTYATYKHEKDA